MSRHHTFMNVNGPSNPPVANTTVAKPKLPPSYSPGGYNSIRSNKLSLGTIIRLPATIARKLAGPRPIVDGSSSSINKQKAYMQRVRVLIYGMYGLSLYGVYYLGTKFKKD